MGRGWVFVVLAGRPKDAPFDCNHRLAHRAMGSEHRDFDLKDGGVLKQLSAQRPISCIFQTYRISRLGFILPLFLVLLCAHSRTCLGACPDHAVGRPACRAWSTSRVLNVRRQAAPPLPLPPFPSWTPSPPLPRPPKSP